MDRQPSPTVTVALLALTWLVANTQRYTPAAYIGSSGILADFSVASGVLVGLLVSAYFPAYGVLQLPVGLLTDRVPPRVLLLGAIGLLGASNLLFALAPNVESAIAARALVGVGSAPVFLCCMKLCSDLSLREYPKRVGQVVTAGGIGSIMGLALLPLLLAQLPWRTVALLLAAEVLLLLPLVALMPLPGSTARAPKAIADLLSGLGAQIRTRPFWWLTLPSMMWCGAYFGVLAWLPRYARDVLHSDAALTGVLPGLFQLGLVFGASAAGALHARRRALGSALFFGAGWLFALSTAALPLLHGLGATWLLYLLAPFMGLLFGCFFIWLGLVSEFVPPAQLGTVTGLINGLSFLPSFFDPPLVGALLDLVDRPQAPDPTYSAAAYTTGFVVLAGSLALGLLAGALCQRGRPAPTIASAPLEAR